VDLALALAFQIVINLSTVVSILHFDVIELFYHSLKIHVWVSLKDVLFA